MLFVAVGTDLNFFRIQEERIGPDLFPIPGGIVDIQDFCSGDFVYWIDETGIFGRGVGVAGNPKQDLGIFLEQLLELFGWLGIVPGFVQLAAGE